MGTGLKYTFILAAYKETFLYDAIKSILCQTYRDFALVIINDASPYDLDTIIDRFDDERLTYIKKTENAGRKNLVRHWNDCLKYADTEYIILASDDDVYEPEFLSEVDRLTTKYPKVDVIRARTVLIDAHDNVLDTTPVLKEYMTAEEYAQAFAERQVISSLQNHAFRLKALTDIGGFVDFPLAWHTDDATVMALSLNGIANTGEVMFRFRKSGESISSAKPDVSSFAKKFDARDRFFVWINTAYLPRLQERIDTADNPHLIKDLEEKIKSHLRQLSLSMIFEADLSTALSLKRAFVRQRFVSSRDYHRAICRKIWLNYKFVFSVSSWRKRLTGNK